MKKLLLILLIFISSSLTYSFDGKFSIRCHACTVEFRTGVNAFGCIGCPCGRAYSMESWLEERTGKHYMIYKCQHGHTLYIPADSDPLTSNYDEILMFDRKDGTMKTVQEYYNSRRKKK